jgi:hypothetical protein
MGRRKVSDIDSLSSRTIVYSKFSLLYLIGHNRKNSYSATNINNININDFFHARLSIFHALPNPGITSTINSARRGRHDDFSQSQLSNIFASLKKA